MLSLFLCMLKECVLTSLTYNSQVEHFFSQHFSASLIAQLVKNLPAVQESLFRFLSWEDPLEKGLATYSSILGLPSWWLSW